MEIAYITSGNFQAYLPNAIHRRKMKNFAGKLPSRGGPNWITQREGEIKLGMSISLDNQRNVSTHLSPPLAVGEGATDARKPKKWQGEVNTREWDKRWVLVKMIKGRREGRWICEGGRRRRHAFGRRKSRGRRRGRESRESLVRGAEELEGEREMERKERDDVFIYNLGKITINYPKVYS